MAEEVDFEEEVEMQPSNPVISTGDDSDAKDDTVVVEEKAEETKNNSSNRKDKIRVKGRGHDRNYDMDDRYSGRGGVFERLQQNADSGPLQSIEGWILFITNVHPEAQEEDLFDKFSEFGDVKNIHLNLDRRTGFVKGYALVEYEKKEDAMTAIKEMNGKPFLEQDVRVDWAFMKRNK